MRLGADVSTMDPRSTPAHSTDPGSGCGARSRPRALKATTLTSRVRTPSTVPKPMLSAAARKRSCPISICLLLHLRELLFEIGHVVLADDLDAGVDDVRSRERGLRGLALGRKLVHPFARKIAELVGLLHDRRLDGAVGDALERAVVLVERDGENLAALAEGVDGGGDGRPVVVPEPDAHAEVRVRVDHVLDVRTRLGPIGVVLALVDDLDVVP